jgi:hypothetical protein
MNRRAIAAVQRRAARRLGARPIAAALLALVLACGSSCVEIDGGAVELSWALRDFAGESRNCESTGLGTVTLCWQPSDGGTSEFVCAPETSRRFVCDVERGSTAFEVPPGPTALWIEVSCGQETTSADPGTYEVPSPVVRTVGEGEVVTLNSLLIVATPLQGCGDRCTCSTQ